MRRLTLAAVALCMIASTFPSSVSASPPTEGPRGRLCSYAAATDPSPEAGEDSMTGQINGGPVVGEPGGELYCTLQVNNNLHSGPDTVVRRSGPADSTGVSIVAAADVAYVSAEDAQDYLCTSYKKADGTWLYWHPTDDRGTIDPTDDIPGHWTSSGWNKPCSAATQFSTRPIFEAADALVFCPPLIAAHHAMGYHRPPLPGEQIFIDHEGDVFIDDNGNGVHEVEAKDEWWFDCPVWFAPYDRPDIRIGALNPSTPAIIDW